MFAEADEIERRHGAVVDRNELNRHLARLAKRAGWSRACSERNTDSPMRGNR